MEFSLCLVREQAPLPQAGIKAKLSGPPRDGLQNVQA